MKQTKERPGVMVYFHLVEPLAALDDVQYGKLMRALMEYARFGTVPQFQDPMLALLWGYFRNAADVDQERYDQRCAQAREAIAKRWGKDTTVYERIPNTNTDTTTEANTNSDTDTKAAAEAPTHASAAANTATKTNPETTTQTSAQTETPTQAGTAPPPLLMEPVATPPRMANSPSWAKMRQASVLRREGEEHEAWREAQIAAITKENQRQWAEARSKRQREAAP